MPYPDSEAEHLQSTFRKWMNREVREYFSDINVDDNWSPDLTSTRQSLLVACLHKDDDSLIMTHLRYQLFNEIVTHEYKVPFVGMPLLGGETQRKFRPQITLYFQEDASDVEFGYEPITGEISFRLMDETEDTLTQAKLQVYATRIKNNFMTGGGYRWHKGKVMVSYSDWNEGYQLQMLCYNKAQGIELAQKVVDIQNHTYRAKKLNCNENEAESEAYPIIPDTKTVLGKRVKEARKRPVGYARFQYANLKTPSLRTPVVLCDRTGIFRNAIERA